MNLGQNPDPVPEKSINSPPAASTPHSSRASPTINISTPTKLSDYPPLIQGVNVKSPPSSPFLLWDKSKLLDLTIFYLTLFHFYLLPLFTSSHKQNPP